MALQLDDEKSRKMFHALSDPNRLNVLALLADGERCVCDIASAIDLKQSLLSFHLRVLREAGLLRTAKVGRWVHYAIDPGVGRSIREFGDALDTAAERAKVVYCC